MIDGVTRRTASRNPLTQILDPDLVPGVIALVIIILIAGLAISRPSDPKIPDVLSSGLALILGFYFGRKAG